MSSMWSIACGFSILAMTGIHSFSSSMIRRTSAASSPDRTNDSAIMSARRCSAQRRSSMSFSLIAGHADGDAGQVDALVVAQYAGDLDAGLHVGAGRPRSRSAGPGRRRSGSRRRPARRRTGPCRSSSRSSWSPAMSRVVMVNSSPGADLIGPSANRPSRIFGPCRSTRMPTALPDVVGRLAHHLVDLLVVLVAAVAEVEPGDVHAGVDEFDGSFLGWTWRARGCTRSLLYARSESLSLDAIAARSHHQGSGRRRDRRRQGGRTGQIAVDGGRRRPSLGDRPHDQRLAAPGVAGRRRRPARDDM